MRLVTKVAKWSFGALIVMAASTLIYDRIPQMCVLAPVDRILGLTDFFGRAIVESNGEVVLAEDNPVAGQNALHSCMPIWSYYETIYPGPRDPQLHNKP